LVVFGANKAPKRLKNKKRRICILNRKFWILTQGRYLL